jgi:hypothetical protein
MGLGKLMAIIDGGEPWVGAQNSLSVRVSARTRETRSPFSRSQSPAVSCGGPVPQVTRSGGRAAWDHGYNHTHTHRRNAIAAIAFPIAGLGAKAGRWKPRTRRLVILRPNEV